MAVSQPQGVGAGGSAKGVPPGAGSLGPGSADRWQAAVQEAAPAVENGEAAGEGEHGLDSSTEAADGEVILAQSGGRRPPRGIGPGGRRLSLQEEVRVEGFNNARRELGKLEPQLRRQDTGLLTRVAVAVRSSSLDIPLHFQPETISAIARLGADFDIEFFKPPDT